jgi:hypothetical protein
MREATGDPLYLNAVVEAFVQAAHISMTDDLRAKCLNNASVGLHDRYDTRGDEADLDRSIEYSRQALRSKPRPIARGPGGSAT